MDGGEEKAQRPADDHHADLLGARQVGQHLGMAGIAVAGEIDRFLVDRRRHDRGDAAVQGPLDRLFHIDGLGRAGLPGHLPRQKPTERLRERVEHRNDPVRRLEP